MNKQRRALMLASAASALPFGAFAQSAYPARPIRLIVPFAPGGTTDIVARIVSDPLGKVLGTSVVVENRAGGGGTVGAVAIKDAAPDGYTVGVATVSVMATNPTVNPKITYNPFTDFVPVTNIAATPNILAVHPSFPARTMDEFLKVVRANPGKYTFSSSGTGGIGHLMGEIFKDVTKTYITHIPYRGAGPALNDTVAGQVNMIFDNLPSSLPFVLQGRLVPIAVAAPKRVASLPNVPTFAELKMEPVNDGAWYGFIVPKGTSASIVHAVHEAVVKVLAMPDVRKRIEGTSSDVVGNTPEQFAQQIRTEYDKYKRVVKARNIVLEG